MNNITILVSGASGLVGYGILKSLRLFKEFRLIGTTIYDISPANCFSNLIEVAPFTTDDNYLDWLIYIIEKYNIDLIIPGIEDDMFVWNTNRSLLEKKTHVLLNNSKLIELCKDKWLFYKELKNNHSKYAIPTSLEFLDKFKYPFLIKPRRGYASKGVKIIKNEKDLYDHINKIGTTHIVQPIIGSSDKEYTVSAFFDKNSNLCCYISLKRRLSKDGYTDIAQTVNLPAIQDALIELADIFKPIGPTNFQFRQDESGLKLLEINPRISSATSIRTLFNYNESKLSVDYFINGIVPIQPTLKKSLAVRYIEEKIVDDGSNF